jgi:cytochrome c biogenesis protein CcmG, thiol:disulfide interchange protein DsbE
MKIRYLTPLILFLLIAGVLWRGLKLHPSQIPSPLINKPAPAFDLPSLLTANRVTNQIFKGQVSLLNVWATWCYACAQEHDYLVTLANNHEVVLYGLDYKDDSTAAKNWLHDHGNPYETIVVDANGDTAIDWGVYGAPETFVIDKHGIIRYKQIGPITPDVWEHDLKPLIIQLRAAP